MKTDSSKSDNGAKATQTQQTRARILRAARDLFNEHGTQFVNTHLIADKAQLSPGNLYYHFKNKEEIIRELFLQMDLYSEAKWTEKTASSFPEFMRFFFSAYGDYRFFFREFASLLQADPVLAKLWRVVFADLKEEMEHAVRVWTKAGIMKEFVDGKEISAFIENCWVLLNFSSVFLEATREGSARQSHRKSVEHLIQFLYPYHTKKGQAMLDMFISE